MVKYTWFLKVGLEETFIYCFTHSFTDDIIKALYVAPTHKSRPKRGQIHVSLLKIEKKLTSTKCKTKLQSYE